MISRVPFRVDRVHVIAPALLAWWLPTLALAATGDLLQSARVPDADPCIEREEAHALALLPGSIFGLDAPSVLVESCNGQLQFYDPGVPGPGGPETLATTLGAVTVVKSGVPFFDHLTVRGERGDLIGCDSSTVYQMPLALPSADPNAVPVVTATPIADLAGEDCAGLASSAIDKHAFASPGFATQEWVDRGDATLEPVDPPFPPLPQDCAPRGMMADPSSVFLLCADSSTFTVRQFNRTTALEVAPLLPAASFAQTAPEGLACDPRSFEDARLGSVWLRSADGRFEAYEVPAASCGFAGGAPIRLPLLDYPAGCISADVDDDGLDDCWEEFGIFFEEGADPAFELAGAVVGERDLFVELDYFSPHHAYVFPQVNSDLMAAFADRGISFHLQLSDSIPHQDEIVFTPCTPPGPAGLADFDPLKREYFGTGAERGDPDLLEAKAYVYRYVLFAHRLYEPGLISNASGCGEIFGNDVVVTLGGPVYPAIPFLSNHPHGSIQQKTGTLMHELGHNIALRHGGGDDANCKPNYLSVMNYTRQFPGLLGGSWLPRFSSGALGPLDELMLDESAGIGGPPGAVTVYGGPLDPADPVDAVSATGEIDWNRDGAIGTSVAANVNFLAPVGGCNDDTLPPDKLLSYDDLSQMDFAFQGSPDFAAGVHLTVARDVPEAALDDLTRVSPDTDADGFPDVADNCAQIPNPLQADANGDGVGDACALDLERVEIERHWLHRSKGSWAASGRLAGVPEDAAERVEREGLSLRLWSTQDDAGLVGALESEFAFRGEQCRLRSWFGTVQCWDPRSGSWAQLRFARHRDGGVGFAAAVRGQSLEVPGKNALPLGVSLGLGETSPRAGEIERCKERFGHSLVCKGF